MASQQSKHTTSGRIKSWISKAIFNTDPGSYFETLVEGIDPMWSFQSIKAKVNKVHSKTSDVITLNLTPNENFAGFKAGQHLQLTVDANGSRKTRTFSISSCPQQWATQGTVEITIKAIEGGEVTQWVHNHLKPGAIVSLGNPQGEFLLPKDAENVLYIAGGSGITPIMSQLRELLDRKFLFKVTLLYYAKTKQDFIFKAELQAIAHRFDNFELYLIETRGKDSGNKLSGHLQESHLQRAVKQSPQHLFVCGPAGLQEQVIAASQALFGDTPTLHKEQFGLAVLKRSNDKNQLQSITLKKKKKNID
ncbi:MAG: ferredoxin reductase, partial [Pseudomonadales bacterium]|nr:ferredoxin reductase [Pseudomonadales bacterium]